MGILIPEKNCQCQRGGLKALVTIKAPRNNAFEFSLLERRRAPVDMAPALTPPLE